MGMAASPFIDDHPPILETKPSFDRDTHGNSNMWDLVDVLIGSSCGSATADWIECPDLATYSYYMGTLNNQIYNQMNLWHLFGGSSSK